MTTKKAVYGIDVGYQYVKACNGEIKIMPSVIGPALDIGYDSGLGKGTAGLTFSDDAGAWFVGEKASKQSLAPVSPQTKARDLDIVKRLALASIGHGGTIDRLVTGLPVDWYNPDKDELEAMLSGRHRFQVDGVDHDLEVKKVVVMPQHFGTLYREIITREGVLTDKLKFSEREVAVLDIGGYTTGGVLSDSLAFIRKSSRSTTGASMGTVHDALKRLIIDKYEIELDAAAIDVACKTRRLNVWKKAIDITGLIQEASHATAAGVIAFAQGLWPTRKTYVAIPVTGGGCELFIDRVQAAIPNAYAVARPQTANVEGMYNYGRLQVRFA